MLRRTPRRYGSTQMRRTALLLLVTLATASALTASPAQAQGNQPPHAWLFGTWTGGIFPAPSNLSAQACLSQPVAIFTRDLVMHATLLEQTLTQRVIETARTTPTGAEFRFAGLGGAPGSLLGLAGPRPGGFGCADPDALVVQRRGENEITFPGCADFPNPLVRCPVR